MNQVQSEEIYNSVILNGILLIFRILSVIMVRI